MAGTAATRVTPVTLAPRAQFGALLALARGDTEARVPLKGAAGEVHELLRERGALFFDELVASTRRLPGDVERGLRELVAAGLVSADGFQGLRQVAGQPNGRGRRRAPRRGHRTGLFGASAVGPSPAGRWALLGGAVTHVDIEEQAEAVAEVLLRRYGVVLRELALREAFTVPWREILRALRRLEARGVVRGGRFVTGFMGEQYALPEAVESLRRVRREPRDGEHIEVSACDPLNLTGVLFPGPRVPALSGRMVVYIDGAPLAAVPEPASAVV